MRKEKIFVILVLLGAFLFGGVATEAGEEWGYLIITNRVESLQNNTDIGLVKDDEYYPNASDGIDQHDTVGGELWIPSDAYALFSIVENTRLDQDVRPNQSTTPYEISLVIHNANLSEEKANYLEVELRQFEGELYADFGGKPLLFQQTSSTNPTAFYPVYDLRKVLYLNNGIVPLENVAPGSYNKDNPYGSGILTMGVKFISDFNDSNDIDIEDFVFLAEDWQKPQGQYIADICGPNGIPDGYVDNYDLVAFCEDWLKDINDPSTW